MRSSYGVSARTWPALAQPGEDGCERFGRSDFADQALAGSRARNMNHVAGSDRCNNVP